jgi:hypothetical protein
MTCESYVDQTNLNHTVAWMTCRLRVSLQKIAIWMIVHFFTTAAVVVMFAIGYHGYSISVVALRLHEFCYRTIVISDYMN